MTMRPTSPNTALFRAVDPRQASYALRAVAVLMLGASFFAEDPLAYLCVVIPVLMAPLLWLKAGAFGIPVLPVISMLFYVYYAAPLLQGSTLNIFRPEDIRWAAISVGLFVLSASIAAWPFLSATRNAAGTLAKGRLSRYARSFGTKSFSKYLSSMQEMERLIFLGLGSGNLFYLATMSGAIGFLGTYIGVVRAVVITLTSVACYLMGYARGAGTLTGQRWIVAFAAFLAVTGLSMSNLLLVGGAINIGAVLLGYVLSAKRIPWLVIAASFIAMSVLNAGKFSMRSAYWGTDSQVQQLNSATQIPGMMVNWLVAGVQAVGSPSDGGGKLLERTSLLHMVLVVQQATPRYIPYLEGQTYAMLPYMLVPRFLQADKPESQAALNLLSIRYGRERAEDVGKTTIGWGLVSEAYANFGNLGVVIAGAIFGVLCGILMRLSATASPLSLAMLVTIASTLTICNMESDFSYLIVTLFQTIGAILLFVMLPRFTRRPVPAMPFAAKAQADGPRSAGARGNTRP